MSPILEREIKEIQKESTAETLKRKSLKKGTTLSADETAQFRAALVFLNDVKKSHLLKITKNKLIESVRKPAKQYSLWGELGL